MAKIYSKGARMYEVGKEKQQALSGESACSAAKDRGEQVDKGQDAPQSRGVQPALLPCPFCGRPAENYPEVATVGCSYFFCDIRPGVQYSWKGEGGAEKAFEIWNTRARPST